MVWPRVAIAVARPSLTHLVTTFAQRALIEARCRTSILRSGSTADHIHNVAHETSDWPSVFLGPARDHRRRPVRIFQPGARRRAQAARRWFHRAGQDAD